MVDKYLEKMAKHYREISYGDVAKMYTFEEECKIYEEFVSLISARFEKDVDKEEIYKLLQSKGRIFTMVVKGREAFYEYETANIGIPHFLRLTSTLCHELVHKLGYLRKDKTFNQMNPVFKEAGTEIVSAKSLDDKEGRSLILNGVYAKEPVKADSNHLSIVLASQINEALGGGVLEKSILTGHDYFKEEIIARWGKDYYLYLSENIKDISRLEEKYWNNYKYFDEEDKDLQEYDLKHRIAQVQDTILDAEFGSRVWEVKNKEESERFLERLKAFGEYRVRHVRTTDDGKREYFDPNFEEAFEDFKAELESKVGPLNTTYDEFDWVKKYPQNEVFVEIEEREADEVYLMSEHLRKTINSQKGLMGFFRKIFGDKVFADDKKVLPRPIDNYAVTYDHIKIENMKKKETNNKQMEVEEKDI